MERHAADPNVVTLTRSDVLEMIRDKLKAEGITRQVTGVQVVVGQGFGEGTTALNDIPSLNLILSDASQ